MMGNCFSREIDILIDVENPNNSTTRPDSNTDSTLPQTMTRGQTGETITNPPIRNRIRGPHNSAQPSAASLNREMSQQPPLKGILKYSSNWSPKKKDNSNEESGQTKSMNVDPFKGTKL